MSLEKKIREDARLLLQGGQDKAKLNLLRVVISEIDYKNKLKENIGKVGDQIAIGVIKSMIKSATEMNNQFEIDILNQYLEFGGKKNISKSELEAEISNIMASEGLPYNMSSMKPILAILNAKYPNSIESKEVASIIKGYGAN